MNIVICHTQVPFVRGGAEELVEGLQRALQAAGHRAEIVALPLKWYPKEQLLKTALAWRLLDLTESNGVPIDRVICTKFPTWAVRHPHKVAWLVHQHRQAYDWYGTPLSDFSGSKEDSEIRERVREIDRRGLAECRPRFAISANVADRLARATGLKAEPLHVPINLQGLQPEAYDDFVFTISRLDRAKRVDLLLQALAKTPGVRAVIAGDGPERAGLERLAHSLGLNERVSFVGRIADEEAVRLYNQARAVYYGPVDEDFGLVTVEALTAGKPVVTLADAGGVLELVEDGVNGLVAAPEPETLSLALGEVMARPELARRLGAAGQRRVAGINWNHVVNELVGAAG